MKNLYRFEAFPEYCSPFTLVITGGNKKNCLHSFPVSSKNEHADWVEWKCERCGAQAKAEVYD